MHASAAPPFKHQTQIVPHAQEAYGRLLLNPESALCRAALTPRS